MNPHPDDLDARLRSWAQHARATAPAVTPPALSARPARKGRWAAAIAVAAAVIATAIAVPLSLQPHTTSPFPTLTGTATATPGTWPATFHGITLDIPDSWTVAGGLPCDITTNTVSFPIGAGFLCGPSRGANVITVEFMRGTDLALSEFRGDNTAFDNSPTTINGIEGTRTQGTVDYGVGVPSGRADHLEVLGYAFPDLQASVRIIGPNKAAVKSLAETLRLVAYDDLGCPATSTAVTSLPTQRPPTRAGADETLLPGSPTSIRVCRYVRGYLEQSSQLTPRQIDTMQTTLRDLNPGLTDATVSAADAEWACRKPGSELGPGPLDPTINDSEAYVIHAEYASGHPVNVIVRWALCGKLGASNGTTTGQLTDDLTQLVIDDAGSLSAEHSQPQPSSH